MILPVKPIPLPEADKLLPPDQSRIYFESCEKLPFEFEASNLSLTNAWWLAEASYAAYSGDSKQINLKTLLSSNWKVNDISSNDNDIRCLALNGPNALILAFRGTRVEGFQDPFSRFRFLKINWNDLVADINFPRQDIGTSRKVHAGFFAAFNLVSGQVRDWIAKARQQSPDKQIWCTGHSLGAALATLAADQLSQEFKVQGLYTYGSPRVGNDVFVNSFPVSNTHRFVHHRDVITLVPPPGMFAHVGQLHYITKDGRLLDAEEKHGLFDDLREGLDFWKKVVKVAAQDFHIGNMSTWPVPVEALADHAPVYYANKTWNLLVGALNSA